MTEALSPHDELAAATRALITAQDDHRAASQARHQAHAAFERAEGPESCDLYEAAHRAAINRAHALKDAQEHVARAQQRVADAEHGK